MSGFTVFSPVHGIAAAVALLTMVSLVWADKRADDRSRVVLWRVWAALTTASQVGTVIYFAWPTRWDPSISFPLHVCDVIGIAASVALWLGPVKRARWLDDVVTLWGLGLCSQGLITPTLTEGPSTLRFYLFFASHITIVATAVLFITSRRWDPDSRAAFRSWVRSTLMMCLYAAIIIPLDAATNWNYGYIGPSKPGVPTVVDVLGPWPQRLIWMSLLGFFAAGMVAIIASALSRRPARRHPNATSLTTPSPDRLNS